MAALLDTIGFESSPVGALDAMLAHAPTGPETLRSTLERIVAAGLADLPRPGRGRTLLRWQALERVARHDLSLAKLFESHADALTIMAELGAPVAGGHRRLYAVWASESRDDPIRIRMGLNGTAVVDGRKSWCSGAAVVDHGLMTAKNADGRRQLVDIALDAPGVRIERDRWEAVGMAGSGSFDVVCEGVAARLVGPVDGYLARPGFWHGGAGVAACWYGAAAAVGTRVRDLQVGRDDVHALAHLGAIDAALASAAALLRECAETIDSGPEVDAMRIALRVRGAVADMADVVVREARRAVGPGPFCNEADLARYAADLPVFVAQWRAEHDRVAQSRALLADRAELARPGWTL